jgi:quercetin dioxygenase-like cupin family protein
MPVITAQEAPVFEAGGNRITGLASPTRGATDIAAWRVEFAAGVASPPHALTREETFVVLSGALTARFADGAETATAGGALIVPADREFTLVAEDGPAQAICMLAVGGQAVTAEGTFTPPWAV